VLAFAIVGIVLLVNSSAKSAKTTTTTTGTSTTTTTLTTTQAAAATCPPATGSTKRVVLFKTAPPPCIAATSVWDATFKTSLGDIVVQMPAASSFKAVNNFVFLARYQYYNGTFFHRVIPGFVVQGGDPQGNGMGGPGYDVPAEISPTEKHLRGTLAMARKGDQVNPERKSSGSQFYICLAPAPFLDGQYTTFGGVVEGMNVVDQIKVGDHIKKVTLTDKLPQ